MTARGKGSITVDAWAAEIEAVHRPMSPDDGWISLGEFATKVGMCRSAAKNRLDAGVEDGRYERAVGLYAAIAGRVIQTTVYRIVDER